MKKPTSRAAHALAAVAACLLFAGPSPLRAEPAPADTAIVEIEGTSVLGVRPGTTRTGSSVIRADLDSLELPAAPTLRRALEELPAVHVRTNSRGEAEISVRGSESRQVSVLYDGLPLTLSWDGRTDASVIPVGAMRRVAFVPGLSSMLTGPNVLGGVIAFESAGDPGPGARVRTEAAAGVDDVGAYGLSASVTAPRELAAGRLTMRAGAGHRDSPGDPLADGIVQPIAAEELRINTDAVATNGFASLRFDRAAGGFVSLGSSAYREERGIAAELGVDAPRFWRYPMIARSLTVLSAGSGARHAPWGGATSLDASFGLDVGRTEIDAFDSIDYDTLASQEDGDQRTLSMRVLASQTLGRNADLRVGVTSSELTYDEILDPGATNRYRHRLWSVAGESVVRFPFAGGGPLDELDVAAGVAFDRSTNPLTGDKPGQEALDEPGARLGLSAQFAGGAVVAHASASRRARFPSLRELYSGALNRFTPNPDLKPERLVAGEAGVALRNALGSVQVVGFVQRLDDAVVRIRVSGLFKRVNQEGLRSRGVEVTGNGRFGPLALDADLTAQAADLLDPTAALAHPENVPELSGALRAAWNLPRGFSLAGQLRYTGDQYAIDPNTDELATLAATTRIDLDLGRAWRLGSGADASELRVMVGVANLTDEATFDAFGLPEPGRAFRLETRLRH